MSSIGSLTLCVQHLRSPDCRERDEAARVIWERFSSRLQALVRRHLDNRIRRREDEQDVLQSMYVSFCIGQLEGKTPPASREELWKLLVRITMCKVVNTAHRHLAARRDVRRERTDSSRPMGRRSLFPRWMLEHVDRAQPSHEEKVIVLDEVERLLQGLSGRPPRRSCSGSSMGSPTPRSPHDRRTVRCVELKMQSDPQAAGALRGAARGSGKRESQRERPRGHAVTAERRARRSTPWIKMPAATATLSEPAPGPSGS